jgi:thiamine pyrophosphate-dependent acetolactate synthase large subunit-like protein
LRFEPFRAIDLGERMQTSARRRPLDLERVARQPRRIEIALPRESDHALAAGLMDFSKRQQRAYEAARDHAPVPALSRYMPRAMHGTDFIQTTEPDLLFKEASLHRETIFTAAQAAAVIHQAIAAAFAGPGVAHLTLPQDVLGLKAEHPVSGIATLGPRPEIVPNEKDVAELARRIDEADDIVIMRGAGCRGLADPLRQLSDRLRAPLIHTFRRKEIMAFDHLVESACRTEAHAIVSTMR